MSAETEIRRLHLESFALELRDCQLRLKRVAADVRARKLSDALATDAEKIAADLGVIEDCAWKQVTATR